MLTILRFITLLAVTLSTSLVAKAETVWPPSSTHPTYGTVEIVTIAKPGIRQHCRVHVITTDRIVCGRGFARKPIAYHRDDVAAIITPIDHSGQHLFYVCISAAIAGTVAAAIFLPPLAAVAIGIPSILFGLSTAMATDGDSDEESILYQRPGTPLTVTLRTH